MRISSVAVILPVSDWSLVLPWYREVLGCRVVHVDESLGQVVHLRLGRSQRFALWLDWGSPLIPRVDPAQTRAPSLVLCVPSLAAVRASLKARGVVPSRTPTGLFMIKDPAGNELLLMPEPRASDARRATRRAAELAAQPHE